jgi:competence protein ComEA
MSRSDRLVIATGGGALILAAAAAWILLAPVLAPPALDRDGALFAAASGAVATPKASGVSSTGTIVVDVQGGVAEPGIRELPAGARLADAIAAAGGFGPDADLDATAVNLNLAAPLTDGAQVRVPRLGDAVAAASPATVAPGTDGPVGGNAGLVNLNTATPEQLEALPGIGPVTVQKLVAARAEAPFTSLEDAVERGILDRGQLEDLQGLATAG